MENNCHSLNDFDPMNEDYFNQNYNSYDTGAGANLPSHLQPALYRYLVKIILIKFKYLNFSP